MLQREAAMQQPKFSASRELRCMKLGIFNPTTLRKTNFDSVKVVP